MGPCALCTYFWSYMLLHFFRLIDLILSPWQTALKHKKVFGKNAFGRVLKPTIFIQICTFFLLYLVFYLCFPLYIFQFIYWYLKRDSMRNIPLHATYLGCILQNKCIKDKHYSTVQNLDTFSAVQNLHKPQQVSSVIRVSNTGKWLTSIPWVNFSPTEKPPTMHFYIYMSLCNWEKKTQQQIIW